MSNKQSSLAKALGKGKAAATSKKAANSSMEKVADLQLLPLEVAKIHPDPEQPRKQWDDTELKELADSILSTNGCHTPIKVKPHPEKMGDYILVYGEGRLRSHQMNNFPIINAIVDFSIHEGNELAAYQNFLEQVSENISRHAMKKIDEANAYQNLMVLHKPKKLTQVQLSKVVGKSKTYISRVLKLLKAPETVQALSKLDVTQNLNILAYLTQAADIITNEELEMLIEQVSNGELDEHSLQRHLSELQNPTPEKDDTSNLKEHRSNDSSNLDAEEYEEFDPTDSGSSFSNDPDYGFYDYENVYDKFIFDVLIQWDKAFEITEADKDEASKKLEEVLSKFEQEGHALTKLLSSLKGQLREEDALSILLNKRKLKEELVKALDSSATRSTSSETLTLDNIELVSNELLLHISGIDKPLLLNASDIKELKEVLA